MHVLRFAVLALLSIAPAGCTISIGDSSDSASGSGDASDPGTEGAAPTASESGESSTSTPTEGSATEGAESSSTAEAATEAAESSSTTDEPTTGPVSGSCGWVAETKIYACGGVGEDPEGLIPIECAEPPVEGAACDGDQGPIADPGCCLDGVNAYCYQGQLIVTVCE